MSADLRIYEVVDSMSGSVSKEQGENTVKEVRRRYVIGQCDNFDHTVETMEVYAPLYASTVGSYWNRTNLSVSGIGNRYFDVTATYRTLVPPASQQNNENGSPVAGGVSWDTTGYQEHITQALLQERIPADAADFEGAINVSGDAVQGIDVVRPHMRYSETWVLPLSTAMRCSFIKDIYSLTGTVNAAPFRCFDAGEVLFLGARGQWQEDQPHVVVSFEFEARANDPDYYPFNSAAETFNKKGWEHVWLRYEDKSNAGRLVKYPIAAYKSRIYKETSWAALLIGSQPICQPRAGSLPQAGNLANPIGLGP